VTVFGNAFAALYEVWLKYALMLFPRPASRQCPTDRLCETLRKLKFDLIELSNVKKNCSPRLGDDDNIVKFLKGKIGCGITTALICLCKPAARSSGPR
jgi:hypothetical protein